MARSIMIQGTMSNVGKSVIAAGLCRIFVQDGYKTAPFKSQNMALNSFITEEGLEMGRAQVMQAEAAKTRPSVCMNPILLKPTSDMGSQVVVRGEEVKVMSAAEYYRRKKEYIPVILDAYHTLKQKYDILVIEGAGSCAEINLKKDDIVNMGLAEMTDAPVLLVGDIDRGGVFAQIVGTIALLEEKERRRVVGTVINKFRGDKRILDPGLQMLEERTKIPVLGVVPWFPLDLEEEDSLTERFFRKKEGALLDIAVVRFPRISNFTDFMALECVEEIAVRYVASAADFGSPDAVILPGSKNTIEDLLWMRQNGLEAKILRHAGQKKLVFGICGGYQMLGQEIADPFGSEQRGAVRGMGLLPIKTVFQREKTRTRVKGRFGELPGELSQLSGVQVEGYEIHMGITCPVEETKPLLFFSNLLEKKKEEKAEGAVLENVCGCYIHGIFDKPGTVQAVASLLLKQKGIEKGQVRAIDLQRHKEEQYDRLADILRKSLDLETIYKVMGLGKK